MLRKKDMILPLILAIILSALPLWIIYNFIDDLIFYHRITKNGILKDVALYRKGILVDGKLKRTDKTVPSDSHYFIVKFITIENKEATCQVGVSKRTYDVVSERDHISIMYLSSQPERCTLPYSVSSMLYLTLALFLVALIFVILSIGFFYYIYKAFKKPPSDKLVKLTTDLAAIEGKVACPKCKLIMTEGYMPTVGGVSWRDRDEPVGIPTMLNGLPGTTFWVRRPKLHAFHCKPCKIITFKYGK